ncbi:ABC transporter permease [Paenibacillus radicis (ex Xue et al. 2023)]|uniref:ABC transporter permease n=1 Tax=Paenibacillus radicis (ex Xue et al. 2023) TaxID=2972489 RepID=A0ABT1YV75_9BACL|nr:ABC transporter permease [Paenibacillus radicis (ex Xue et al. 2023)]MCR8636854.1 ABC transporter permease [Paenibacillus radicis (ex Xue et al. 2023)]
MSSFFRHVQNEQMKIYSRTRTWVMLGIVVLAVLSMALMMKYAMDLGVNHAFPFLGMSTSLTWLVFIFSVIIAGDSVASEFTWGTIKLLLIRPVTRAKILAAKYVSVFIFLITLLLVLFITSYFVGLLFFGLSGTITEQDALSNILRVYGLKWVDLLMSVTLAFMISAAFRSSSLAIGLSMLLMFTANGVVLLLASLRYTWAKYLLFANTDLSPYFMGGKPLVEGMTLGFSVSMLIAYWVLFYGAAWLLFTKRDVAG